MNNFYVITPELNMNYCGIYDMPGALDAHPDNYYPAAGIRVDGSFPKEYAMSNDVPGIKIADLIQNALNYFMVSGRMKSLLEKYANAEIQFIRFTLLNHKGRKASDDCYIVNVIDTIDCVDTDRTEGEKDPVNKGRYMFLERLFLDHDKIDSECNIFRIASFPKVIVVREGLKQHLEQEGITCAEFSVMGSEIYIE